MLVVWSLHYFTFISNRIFDLFLSPQLFLSLLVGHFQDCADVELFEDVLVLRVGGHAGKCNAFGPCVFLRGRVLSPRIEVVVDAVVEGLLGDPLGRGVF